MRLIVRGLTERGSKSKLGISVDIMRRDVNNAQREWDEVRRGLAGLPNFTEVLASSQQERPSNYEYQGGELIY